LQKGQRSNIQMAQHVRSCCGLMFPGFVQ
jgi:hypothetical protein